MCSDKISREKFQVEEQSGHRALKTLGSVEGKDEGNKEKATKEGEAREYRILKASEEYFKQRQVNCVPYC